MYILSYKVFGSVVCTNGTVDSNVCVLKRGQSSVIGTRPDGVNRNVIPYSVRSGKVINSVSVI